MTALEVFQLYLPIKLHFTTEKFNVFETKRVKNTDYESFSRRVDIGKFHSLANKFKNPRECVQYFAANFAYGLNDALYKPLEAEQNLKLWIKRKESITEVFKNDFEKLQDDFKANNILQKYVAGIVTLESVAILSCYSNLIESWKDNPLWESEILRVKKSQRFVKFDPVRIELIMQNN